MAFFKKKPIDTRQGKIDRSHMRVEGAYQDHMSDQTPGVVNDVRGDSIWNEGSGFNVRNVVEAIQKPQYLEGSLVDNPISGVVPDTRFPSPFTKGEVIGAGPAVNPPTTIDAKYGKKHSDYRPGRAERQAPAMILPGERSPEMIQEEEDIMDA